MRGRPGCPTGQEKKSVGATVSNPLFYKERLGTKSPPHPPQCAHWGTFPPRGRLWGWEPPCRVSHPLPSNGLARQGTPSRSGRQPAKNPKGPTYLSAPPTRPVGHASQSFPARRRGKKMRSCFDRLRRPKHSSQPPVCPQGARSGCNPQFWEGPPTKQAT